MSLDHQITISDFKVYLSREQLFEILILNHNFTIYCIFHQIYVSLVTFRDNTF